jgi:hypothetical protein
MTLIHPPTNTLKGRQKIDNRQIFKKGEKRQIYVS